MQGTTIQNVPNVSTNKEDVSFRIVKPKGQKWVLRFSQWWCSGFGFRGICSYVVVWGGSWQFLGPHLSSGIPLYVSKWKHTLEMLLINCVICFVFITNAVWMYRVSQKSVHRYCAHFPLKLLFTANQQQKMNVTRYGNCKIFRTFYFVLWPTIAQLFHKLSHSSYMFRHYRVILRELLINTLPSCTSISKAAVGNTVHN